ncbi:hypothetical protein [Duganella sp. P38]|uniref:hypothetical protein n=1 Tax=Duganella sp. P38 TaxID=3423949 RepID=UPI003D7AC236
MAQRKVIKSQTIFAETPLATSKVVLLSHCTLFLHFLQGVPVKKREKYCVIPAKAGIHTAHAEATAPWIAACAAMTLDRPVIPAKAGIHTVQAEATAPWIAAARQ